MVNKQLIAYIKENLEKGHSLTEIRKFLSAYGWGEKDIDEGILAASTGQTSPLPNLTKVKKKGHKKLIVAIIVLIILIFLFIYVIADILNYFTDLFPETALPFNITDLIG